MSIRDLSCSASWAGCPPCRSEIPELQAAYETLAPQGIVMLGISMREDPADAIAYADRVGATFPVRVDPTWAADMLEGAQDPRLVAIAESTRTWQINNWPTHVFIDRDGIVRTTPWDDRTAVSDGQLTLDTAPASTLQARPGDRP